MTAPRRNLIVGLVIWLAAGAGVGWLLGSWPLGGLVAALVSIGWLVYNISVIDKALTSRDPNPDLASNSMTHQVLSRLQNERNRGNRYKEMYRQLFREFRHSTDALPDGAIIMNDANEMIVCNRASRSLAGIKPKKDRGQRVDNILRDPDLTRLLETNDATVTVDIASPVDENAWLNCRVVPYGSGQKLLLLRDVTDRMRLNKMRRDFVANASHELRSPLTVISGYLDSLASEDDIPEEWVQPMKQMRSGAHRMTAIVSELLELSRLESGDEASRDMVIDMPALLMATRQQYADRKNTPTVELFIETAVTLLGDSHEIISVVDNLVSNACRHTDTDGTITIRWRATVDGAELSVSDTGEGIAAEHIPRLTERFFRVDKGRSRADGGSGLGLAIVKHALSRHDAELDVDSEVGEGTTFTCRFPADRVVDEPAISMTS